MVNFSSCIISALVLLQAAHQCDGLVATLKRVKNSLSRKERSRDELKIGIAGFYDRSSKLWEDVWGEVSFFLFGYCILYLFHETTVADSFSFRISD